MNFKELIGRALVAKVRAGAGSRYKPGVLKKRVGKRQKTRQFFLEHPEVEPWPLRTRLAGKSHFDFSDSAKRERRANGPR